MWYADRAEAQAPAFRTRTVTCFVFGCGRYDLAAQRGEPGVFPIAPTPAMKKVQGFLTVVRGRPAAIDDGTISHTIGDSEKYSKSKEYADGQGSVMLESYITVVRGRPALFNSHTETQVQTPTKSGYC